MRRLLIALALLPCLALPAAAQSGLRAPTSSGVVHGQGWNTGQDLHRAQDANARRRVEAQRRVASRNYTGLPTRTRGMPGRRVQPVEATSGGTTQAPVRSN